MLKIMLPVSPEGKKTSPSSSPESDDDGKVQKKPGAVSDRGSSEDVVEVQLESVGKAAPRTHDAKKKVPRLLRPVIGDKAQKESEALGDNRNLAVEAAENHHGRMKRILDLVGVLLYVLIIVLFLIFVASTLELVWHFLTPESCSLIGIESCHFLDQAQLVQIQDRIFTGTAGILIGILMRFKFLPD